jgi:hypothetical protein
VVVAVGGLSFEAREIAAPEVAGSFPVSSSRCIRDLRSSNSSQTVDGAVVDTVDSVPSTARGVSGTSCMSVVCDTRGDELYVRGAEYDRFDCLYDARGGNTEAGSGWEGLLPYDADSGEISRLANVLVGVLGVERELAP